MQKREDTRGYSYGFTERLRKRRKNTIFITTLSGSLSFTSERRDGEKKDEVHSSLFQEGEMEGKSKQREKRFEEKTGYAQYVFMIKVKECNVWLWKLGTQLIWATSGQTWLSSTFLPR